MAQVKQTRRSFLSNATKVGAALAVPYFVPSTVLGNADKAAASDRIVMGGIGTGGMGRANIGAFMYHPKVQMVAVCDVDQAHRKLATDYVNEQYKNQDCQAYADFRELLGRKDIDAVIVATPDHWHALASIAAADAGKHVYCEKPLANSVGEGRAICDAVKRNGIVLQTGSHERSTADVRRACELVRNGRLGKIHTVEINMPCNQDHHQKVRALTEVPPAMSVPEGFDYDFWLGPAEKEPYTEKRCHFWWRFNTDYGGGEMTDRGAHIIDIAQLALDADDSGPVKYQGVGISAAGGLYDAFMDFQFENVYDNGVRMVGTNHGPRGLRFLGDEGWLMVHIHGGKLEAGPASILSSEIKDDELHLGRAPEFLQHRENFLDCVVSGEKPFAHAEVGHRTATICHLNNIAMKLGRPLKWDPQAEQILEDDEANAMLSPNMRSPWSLG